MDRRLRGVLAAVIALALAVGFCSCRRAVAVRDELRVAIPQSPLSLDPRLATDAEGDKIASLLCDGLFTRDEHLELVPAIAERYEQLSDRSYRFWIREGIRFHDGAPLSAADVAFTYRSMIDGSIASPFAAAFERVRAMEVEGPLVLRVDLAEPYAPFLSQLTRGIVSQQAALKAGRAFSTMPVCAGPYRLERFEADRAIALEAFPAYFGKAPKARRLLFEVIKDDNVRVLKLLRGDIDLVQNGIPRMLLANLLTAQALAMKEGAGTVMTYLGMNLADPVLANPKVRRAIALAIDRDAIIAHRFAGFAEKANSILAPSGWAADTGLPQIPYDPARAKELLDEAGFRDPDGDGPGARLALTTKTSTSKERIDIARMIAHQLAQVGIEVRVVPYEWGTFYRDIRKGNFQLYTLSWVGIVDPDIFYEAYGSEQEPPAGLNRGHYRNPEVDALVRAGRSELDQQKRKAIYAEVQRILLEDLPSVPLWYEKNVVVYRKGLAGVWLRPDASYRPFVDVEVREP
jgi:peptide/nickel transport system substrate-binding protein